MRSDGRDSGHGTAPVSERPEPRGPWHGRRLRLLIAAATVLGAGLRLATAPHFDFYGDEFWTLQWSRASAGEILGYFGGGLTMHLYILAIKVWTFFVGFSPLVVKLPSLIAGVALIPLVFWLGGKWLDPHTAALAALMVALNTQMIDQSRTARVYMILAVVVLLSMFVFVRALRARQRRDLLLGPLVNASLLALSIHSIYVLLVQGAMLAFETLSRRLPLRRLAAFVAGFAFSLGLAVLFYHRAFDGLGRVTDLAGVTMPERIVHSLWLPAQKLWTPFQSNHPIAPWLMLAALGIGAWVAWRRHPLTGRLLVLWAFLPPAVYFLQRSVLPGFAIARYTLPAVPAQLLLIALGALLVLRGLIPGSKPGTALGLAMLMFTAATFSAPTYRRNLLKQWEPTEQAMRRIRATAEPGDLITSFPDNYYELLKLRFGDAAVKLTPLVDQRALPHSGRMIILVQALPSATRWWRSTFEIEEIGGPRYLRRLYLLTSKQVAGPDALRALIDQFHFGFVHAAASGGALHNDSRIHYRNLARIHRQLALLTNAIEKTEERKEHLQLAENPRAWDGDMASYPIIKSRLQAAELSLRILDRPDPAVVGENVVFTIAVTNSGPKEATGVRLTHAVLGSSASLVSVNPPDICGAEDGVVTCAIGRLSAGDTFPVIEVIATAMEAGTMLSTATVRGSEPDSDPRDDTVQAQTETIDPGDLVFLDGFDLGDTAAWK